MSGLDRAFLAEEKGAKRGSQVHQKFNFWRMHRGREENREIIFQEAAASGCEIFFRHLKMRADGGLSPPKQDGRRHAQVRLDSRMRVFSAGILIFSVILNFETVFVNFGQLVLKTDADLPFVVLVSPTDHHLVYEGLIMVSAFECIVMFGMGACTIFVILRYVFSSEGETHGYVMWHRVHLASHRLVRFMTNFSAMRTLHFLNPQVFSSELALEMTLVEEGASVIGVICFFFVKRLVLGMLGFVAFVLKFSSLVSLLLKIQQSFFQNQDYDTVLELTLLVGFINQAIGITQVFDVETQRLFLFIFGGENVNIEAGELDRQEVFLAFVTKHICEDLFKQYPPTLRKFKRFIALVTFDHLDIQSMILDEDESKEVDARSIRKRTPKNETMRMETSTITSWQNIFDIP